MNKRIINISDFIVNNLSNIGIIMVILAFTTPYFTEFMGCSAIIHFMNEGAKSIKEKNKWKDQVAFMEYFINLTSK